MGASSQAAVASLHFTFQRAPIVRLSVAVVTLFRPEPQPVSADVGIQVDALAHGRAQTSSVKVADTVAATRGGGVAICLAVGTVVLALAAVAVLACEIPETNTLASAIAKAVATARSFPVAIPAGVAIAIVVACARCTFDVSRGSGIPGHDSLDALGLLLEWPRRMSHYARASDALAHIAHGHTTGTIDLSCRYLRARPARLNKASAGVVLRRRRTSTAVVRPHVAVVTFFIQPPFSVAIFGETSRIKKAIL